MSMSIFFLGWVLSESSMPSTDVFIDLPSGQCVGHAYLGRGFQGLHELLLGEFPLQLDLEALPVYYGHVELFSGL